MFKKADYELMRENINLIREAIKKNLINHSPVLPIRLINESQFKWIELNETQHYPNKLDVFYESVWEKVAEDIPSVKIGDNKSVDINFPNKYFEDLSVILLPYLWEGDKIADFTEYLGNYDTSCDFKDGKVINPVITLNYPIARDGFTWEGCIKASLIHELTHLYDDVIQRRAKGNDNISSLISRKDRDVTMDSFMDLDKSELSELIKQMLYLYQKTEEKAYLAQAMNELEEVGCNQKNYRTTMKETSLYKKIETLSGNTKRVIESCSYDDLFSINSLSWHTMSNIPRIKYFDEDKYREMLISFTENIRHEYLKKYYSMVMYYLTSWKGGHRIPKTGKPNINETYFYL